MSYKAGGKGTAKILADVQYLKDGKVIGEGKIKGTVVVPESALPAQGFEFRTDVNPAVLKIEKEGYKTHPVKHSSPEPKKGSTK